MLRDLGQRGLNEIHLESGHKLNGSFLREGLVDEVLLYMAPLLIGQGRGMTHMGPLEALGDAIPLAWQEVTRVGPDLRLRAHIRG